MTLESLARTIAKARHGTDAMWPNYIGAAEAVVDLVARRMDWLDEMASIREVGDAFDAEADYWWGLLAKPADA